MCLAILALTTATAQHRKSTDYCKVSDLQGIWYATQGYDETTKQWKELDAGSPIIWAFTDTESDGKPLALLSVGGDTSRFVYSFSRNKLSMFNLYNHSELMVTIKVSSLVKGKSFVGVVQTFGSPHKAKFRFAKIDEK